MIKIKGKKIWLALICILILVLMMFSHILFKSGLLFNNNQKRYNAEILYQYKTPYVGNNSKVINIVNNLLYDNFRQVIFLKTDSLPYSIIINYSFQDTELSFKDIEKPFYKNTVLLFALIDNVDIVNYNIIINDKIIEYEYLREKVQKYYDKDLRQNKKSLEKFKKFVTTLN